LKGSRSRPGDETSFLWREGGREGRKEGKSEEMKEGGREGGAYLELV